MCMCVSFVGFFVRLFFWLVHWFWFLLVCVCVCGGVFLSFFSPLKILTVFFMCAFSFFFLSFSASFLTSLVKQLLKKLNDPSKNEPRMRIFLTD